MTRGSVRGLPSAGSLGERLPGVYQDDAFVQGFTEGLDTVLAPVFLTLDCLYAYLDPRLTPRDFLPWLASWVGIELDSRWPLPVQRRVVANASSLHACWGTRRGLVAYLELLVEREVEVTESGAVAWSAEPGGAAPGQPHPAVRVVVRAAARGEIDEGRLTDAVRDAVPAHVAVQVDILPP
jgi:phage tail-like protein